MLKSRYLGQVLMRLNNMQQLNKKKYNETRVLILGLLFVLLGFSAYCLDLDSKSEESLKNQIISYPIDFAVYRCQKEFGYTDE